MKRAAVVACMVLFLAVLGLCLGAPVGILVGELYTRLAHTSGFEGYSGMLVFFTFGPLGAILGGLALPALYLVALLRSWRRSGAQAGQARQPDGGRDAPRYP